MGDLELLPDAEVFETLAAKVPPTVYRTPAVLLSVYRQSVTQLAADVALQQMQLQCSMALWQDGRALRSLSGLTSYAG